LLQIPSRNTETWQDTAHAPARGAVRQSEEQNGVSAPRPASDREIREVQKDSAILLREVMPQNIPPPQQPR
jgi:hypothetical protein